MNKVKTFSEFVNEAYDDHYVTRALDNFPEINGPLSQVLDEVYKQMNHMMGRTYAYNREKRDINEEHYAINVKTYNYPDVDEWRESISEPDASEDQFWQRWGDYLNFEIEDFEENIFLEKFGDVFDKIRMGGRSGGWMCLVPSKGPEYLNRDLDSYLDDYVESLNELDMDEMTAVHQAISLDSEERDRLIDLGILELPASYEDLMNKYNELLREAKEALAELKKQEEGCKFVETAHNEWEKEVKQNFLESERESY